MAAGNKIKGVYWVVEYPPLAERPLADRRWLAQDIPYAFLFLQMSSPSAREPDRKVHAHLGPGAKGSYQHENSLGCSDQELAPEVCLQVVSQNGP